MLSSHPLTRLLLHPHAAVVSARFEARDLTEERVAGWPVCRNRGRRERWKKAKEGGERRSERWRGGGENRWHRLIEKTIERRKRRKRENAPKPPTTPQPRFISRFQPVGRWIDVLLRPSAAHGRTSVAEDTKRTSKVRKRVKAKKQEAAGGKGLETVHPVAYRGSEVRGATRTKTGASCARKQAFSGKNSPSERRCVEEKKNGGGELLSSSAFLEVIRRPVR